MNTEETFPDGKKRYFTTISGYAQEIPREAKDIPEPWQKLWHETQVWYGDIRASETPEQFITRMMEVFELTEKGKSNEEN